MNGRLILPCVLLLIGCQSSTVPVSTESDAPIIGQQLKLVDPALRSQRFSVLLGFESDVDVVFVSGQSSLVATSAHTGKGALRVSPGATAAVKLSSLMSGREFPGDWTLVGGYLTSDRDVTATVTLVCSGKTVLSREVRVSNGSWTPAFLDLTRLAGGASCEDARLTFHSSGALLCDDVSLIENTTWLVGGRDDRDAPWTIVQRGFSIRGENPGSFAFVIETVESKPTGWQVREVCDLRAVFDSPGSPGVMSIYNDGRRYTGGTFDPISNRVRQEPQFAASHESPAELVVSESMGRLVRNSSGDANNDGYNETLGAYQLAAAGARFDVQVIPRNRPAFRPVLEIAGLPAGKALVTVDGRLVESTCRTASGNLLIDIPLRIDRPVTVNVRVE
jgi:hypothetical protein